MQCNTRLQDYWKNNHVAEAAGEVVDSHPFASAFGMFGIGLGVGVAVGLLIVDHAFAEASRPATMADRTFDALANVLPESVMRTIRS